MRFRIAGEGFTWYLARELEVLTDKANIEIDGISFDESTKTLRVPLRRYGLAAGERAKRRLLTSYRYDRHRPINALLTIGNVVDWHIARGEYALPEIEVILGAQLREDCLLLRSAQESRGKSCFLLEARFDQLNLSLEDSSL